MFFLTYNDLPSGIYKSQVIDVVKYMNSIQVDDEVRLIALISLRGFYRNRKKIKELLPSSIILPMFPKARFWKLNYFVLFIVVFFSSEKKIMARGPFACKLALRLRKRKLIKKVIFDGRGAYFAELNEYDVVKSKGVKDEIARLEKEVVLESDHRLAVSQALVNYWKREFGYTSNEHVIIPCTLGNEFVFDFPSEDRLNKLRLEFGYRHDDVVFIYSGSAAGWQSFGLVDSFMSKLMDVDPKIKLIILSGHFDDNAEVIKRHKDWVKITWVAQKEVKNYLLISDYGILYRETTVTNEVASPVKFAEYLSCGLKVLISEKLGDYTEFAEKNSIRYSGNTRPDHSQKKQIHGLAQNGFVKSNYQKEYLKLLDSV